VLRTTLGYRLEIVDDRGELALVGDGLDAVNPPEGSLIEERATDSC
jgi:hypothetical protein